MSDSPGSSTVGSHLCLSLVELFLSQLQLSSDLPAPAVSTALRGLLTFSPTGKATALDLGLHSSLLEACSTLAGTSAAAAPHAVSRPTGSGAASSKLEQLKRQRAAAAGRLQAVPVAARSGATRLRRQAAAGAGAEEVAEACGAEKGAPGSSCTAATEEPQGKDSPVPQQQQQQPQQPRQYSVQVQRLLLFLDILKCLAHQSQKARWVLQ